MFLDAADIAAAEIISVRPTGADPIYAPWADWEPAAISHHGRECCEVAREWFANYDLSQLNGAPPQTAPRWIRTRFGWGPVVYPIFWCDIARRDHLDCGVHAALAQEVMCRRGISAYRAQFVLEFSRDAAAQWRRRWESEKAHSGWLSGQLAYHEGCAIGDGGDEIKLWDPSSEWWVDPRVTSGYGSFRAVRVVLSKPAVLSWSQHQIHANVWNVIDGG